MRLVRTVLIFPYDDEGVVTDDRAWKSHPSGR